MPPLPAVASAIRITLFADVGGKQDQGCRVFYRYTGGPPNAANLGAIGTTFGAQVAAQFPPLAADVFSYTNVEVLDLSANDAAVTTTPISVAGGANYPVSPDTCVVSSYQVAARYRGGHPRTYWPLGNGNVISPNGEWEDSYVTSCQNAIGSVVASVVGLNEGSTTIAAHIAVSYYQGFTSVEDPITHRWRNVPTLRSTPQQHDVTGITVRSYVGSQRRRRQLA